MTSPAPLIVVGVDGSPASVQALRWAMTQAGRTSATVQAVTSWHTPSQYGFEFPGDPVDWAEIARRTLETALKEAGDGGPVDVQSLVLHGHPATVLVDASVSAELLVVGSRGHGGFAGLLLGSVSEYVIAHASCPVLVIRDQASVPPLQVPVLAE
jgi:nucleotide-binding universal stress UspA family protein